MSEHVYADYAAATPVDDRVVLAMSEVSKVFGNPSSRHSFGKDARLLLDQSRKTIARFLNCVDSELTFTSSGTESNNLAVLGIARANRSKGNHIITSAIEHPSVLNACRALERDGYIVTYLPVDHNGAVSLADLEKALTDRTVLVSIHLANSEIGVIQDISKLSKITHSVSSAYFHTDACQATTYLSLDIRELGVDALSFNGSKIYGPRGIAALFVADGVNIFPIIYGGGQEKSLRSGTENLLGVAGLATAIEIAGKSKQESFKQVAVLRDRLQQELERIQGVVINVKDSNRLPNHLSIVISECKQNDLVRAMNEIGVAVSSGSACSSKSLNDSHVLVAIGLSSDQINKTLRVTLGKYTTQEEVQKIINAVKLISK